MPRLNQAARRAGLSLADVASHRAPRALNSAPPEVEDAAESLEASRSPVPWNFETDHGWTGSAQRLPSDLPPGELAVDAPVMDVPHTEHAEPLTLFQQTETPDGRPVLTRVNHPAAVEQYRKLAATLHLGQIDKGWKVALVAGALSGEGKTLTSTNLTLTLSESYRRRVLLIDADLRRPTIHEMFGLPNVSGLNEGLKSTRPCKIPLVQVSRHLSVLTAGRPDHDPMSTLTSQRMRQVIAEAAENFDWVILDTPPVGLLSDAHLLAQMVDVAILVISVGKTPFRLIQRAVESLGREKLIGVVLNRMDETSMAQSYGYAYGYGYYSSYFYGPKTKGSSR